MSPELPVKAICRRSTRVRQEQLPLNLHESIRARQVTGEWTADRLIDWLLG